MARINKVQGQEGLCRGTLPANSRKLLQTEPLALGKDPIAATAGENSKQIPTQSLWWAWNCEIYRWPSGGTSLELKKVAAE